MTAACGERKQTNAAAHIARLRTVLEGGRGLASAMLSAVSFALTWLAEKELAVRALAEKETALVQRSDHAMRRFQVNGSHMNFVMKNGVLQELLKWTDSDSFDTEGHLKRGSHLNWFTLKGKTFGTEDTKDQWFDECALRAQSTSAPCLSCACYGRRQSSLKETT